jgi:cell division protein FtsL
MFDLQQKNKLRRFFYSPAMVGVVVVVALYFLYSTFSIYMKMVKSREELDKSRKEMLALAEKGRRLNESINSLQTKEGMEVEIRSKFGVAKNDEAVAVIVEDQGTSSPVEIKKSLLDKFLDFFGM